MIQTERRCIAHSGRSDEATYAGVTPEGPESIFVEADLDKIFGAIKQLPTVDA